MNGTGEHCVETSQKKKENVHTLVWKTVSQSCRSIEWNSGHWRKGRIRWRRTERN
jgi:hypothetical protein